MTPPNGTIAQVLLNPLTIQLLISAITFAQNGVAALVKVLSDGGISDADLIMADRPAFLARLKAEGLVAADFDPDAPQDQL